MSYHYIREAGDFLLAVPPASWPGGPFLQSIPADMDKFRYSQFWRVSIQIGQRSGGGCCVFMECRLRQISRMGDRPFCVEVVT